MRLKALVVCAAVSSASTVALAGSLTVDVLPSIAPNVYGSPSWDTYASNSLYALQNGLTNYGGSPNSTPTAYQVAGPYVSPGAYLATSFNSWLGVANPAAPFNNELGNRVHFGAVITDTSSTFDLAEVSFTLDSNDPGNTLQYHDNLAGTDFSHYRIGIYYGADGVKGGGDDIIYDASNIGSDTVPINELYYLGAANSNVPPTPADLQDYLDYYTGVTLTANYAVTDNSSNTASASASVTAVVPLPASLWSGTLLLTTLAATHLHRSRKRTLA